MQDRAHIASGVREGDVLAGKYRIDRILGAGGMGIVVAAHHLSLDERVAIKLMLPEALANEEAVARFAREARAAVKIKSEHVARVSDVGELPNGAPYMVMEYLEGIDLGDWLEQRGRLPVDQAVEFVLQACEAIAEAHVLGIVHRDLKPRNLFVIRRADGLLSVKVLDFGISKTTGAAGLGPDLGMTKTTAVMGLPLYMSPEQMLASRDADARSDIWALGVILFELLTAALPFVGDTMPELVAKILGTTPPPLRTQRSDAPPGLEAIIGRCLERERARRFQTVGDLAVALLEFAPKRAKASVERISGVMSAAGLAAPAIAKSSFESEHPPPGAGTAAAWGTTATKPRSGGKFVGVALGIVAIAAIAVGVARRHVATPAPVEPVTSSASTKQEPSKALPAVAEPSATAASGSAVAPPPPSAAPPSPSAAPPGEETPSVAPATATAVPVGETTARPGVPAVKRPAAPVRPSPKRPAPVAAPAAPAVIPAPPPAAPPPHPKPASDWGGRL